MDSSSLHLFSVFPLFGAQIQGISNIVYWAYLPYVTKEKESSMSYVLLVFSNRQSALAAYDRLLRSGISARTVNTPRALSASCGISLAIPTHSRTFACELARRQPGFVGAYRVASDNQIYPL